VDCLACNSATEPSRSALKRKPGQHITSSVFWNALGSCGTLTCVHKRGQICLPPKATGSPGDRPGWGAADQARARPSHHPFPQLRVLEWKQESRNSITVLRAPCRNLLTASYNSHQHTVPVRPSSLAVKNRSIENHEGFHETRGHRLRIRLGCAPPLESTILRTL
jgi:hypothetical protein